QRSVHDFTLEEYLEIVSAKSGSLFRLACRLGVVCADGDEQTYEQFSELGKLLGIAHQLDNDCHDLYHLIQVEFSAPTDSESALSQGKSDLLRGKKTLPIIFAAQRGYIIQDMDSLTSENKKVALRALHEGILSAWGVCLLYRERVREVLQKI